MTEWFWWAPGIYPGQTKTVGCNFTFNKEKGLNRSLMCQLKMKKRPHMVFFGFGTQVAFHCLLVWSLQQSTA